MLSCSVAPAASLNRRALSAQTIHKFPSGAPRTGEIGSSDRYAGGKCVASVAAMAWR